MGKKRLPEKWKKIIFEDNISKNEKYQISTRGRAKSFKVDADLGKLIKLFPMNNYLRIPLKQTNGKRTARYVHKLVAKAFIEKTDDAQGFVIHLDYNKENNKVSNLAWATKEEKELHYKNSPIYKDPLRRIKYSKLTLTKVKNIKRKLKDPNRKETMKKIAEHYGISEMQLYRIKVGENWGHVKID